MKSNQIIIIIFIAVVVGAAGFFGGMQYEKGKATSEQNAVGSGRYGRRFGQGGGASGTGMAPVRGSIVASDSESITVKLTDGSTKLVLLNNQTMIAKTTTGSKTDLTNGSQVLVIGSTNSDGSVTAQNIQLGGGMFGAGRYRPSPTQ